MNEEGRRGAGLPCSGWPPRLSPAAVLLGRGYQGADLTAGVGSRGGPLVGWWGARWVRWAPAPTEQSPTERL